MHLETYPAVLVRGPALIPVEVLVLVRDDTTCTVLGPLAICCCPRHLSLN